MATIGCGISHKDKNIQINAATTKQKQNYKATHRYFFKIL
jgi:hypothetical protein